MVTKNSALVYEQQENLKFDEDNPIFTNAMSKFNKQLVKILQPKGFNYSRTLYLDLFNLYAKANNEQFSIITPIDITKLKANPIDFAIDFNIKVKNYDEVFYVKSHDTIFHNVIHETSSKPIINVEPTSIGNDPFFNNNTKLLFNDYVQPLVPYYGCDDSCTGCPAANSSVINRGPASHIYNYGKKLYELGKYHGVQIKLFMLNLGYNSLTLKDTDSLIKLSVETGIKYIYTVAPHITHNQELYSKFIKLLPYIDVLFVEGFTSEDSTKFNFTPDEIIRFLSTMKAYRNSTTDVILTVTIDKNNDELVEVLHTARLYYHLVMPTFINMDTKFDYNYLLDINDALIKFRRSHEA